MNPKFALDLAARIYWRVFRPKTFGVKLLIHHPDSSSNAVLVVRHTYGNSAAWHLPGGGYNPHNETPVQAAQREALEELGVEVSRIELLGEYKTSAQGKRDTVTIVDCRANQSTLKVNGEIAQAMWVTPEIAREFLRVYEITLFSLDLLARKGAA